MITPAFSLTATERVLPKLSLDFISASLDSRVTFTRADATATRINSSGYVETVAADTPRFDFDAVTLACKGLLIEETRTNLATNSEDFSAWTSITGATTVSSTETSPANTANATSMYATSVGGRYSLVVTFTGDGVKTISVFLKKGTSERIRIAIRDVTAGSTLGGGQIDWAGTVPTVTTFAGTNTVFDPVALPNGWYRFAFSVNSIIAANTNQLWIYPSTLVANSTVTAWGYQAENATFPTSYIPTAGTTVTRNADVATMTGTNFSDWYNATEGTVVASFVINGFDPATQDRVLTITDGVNAELDIRQTTASALSFVVAGGVSGSAAIVTASGISAGTLYKVAGAYKNNDIAAAANAGTVGTDTSCSVPVVDRMRIGVNSSGSATTVFNGTIRSILYYPQRLTNSEVRAFSK
jgi:hypothetical protein